MMLAVDSEESDWLTDITAIGHAICFAMLRCVSLLLHRFCSRLMFALIG